LDKSMVIKRFKVVTLALIDPGGFKTLLIASNWKHLEDLDTNFSFIDNDQDITTTHRLHMDEVKSKRLSNECLQCRELYDAQVVGFEHSAVLQLYKKANNLRRVKWQSWAVSGDGSAGKSSVTWVAVTNAYDGTVHWTTGRDD